MRFIENAILRSTMRARIEGPLKINKELFSTFLSLPEDPLPEFEGPAGYLRGRSKDHPRYARWMHAFVKFFKPNIAVEVGTNAGGSAIGIAKAMAENGKGRLICIDNGEGMPKCFPRMAEQNIRSTGLKEERLDLICEDSQTAIPRIASQLKKKVDVYLVDAAHSFEAALTDIENALPMMRPKGFILVHDVDPDLDLGDEVSTGHSSPVYEAFHRVVKTHDLRWCRLKFIRKHLGIMLIN